MPKPKFKTIKVYNPEKAPAGSEFYYKRIEEDGFIKLTPPDFNMLKSNQRWVYFYKVFENKKQTK